MQRFITAGTVVKLPYPKYRTTREVTDPAKLFIFHLKSPELFSVRYKKSYYTHRLDLPENTVRVLQ